MDGAQNSTGGKTERGQQCQAALAGTKCVWGGGGGYIESIMKSNERTSGKQPITIQ